MKKAETKLAELINKAKTDLANLTFEEAQVIFKAGHRPTEFNSPPDYLLRWYAQYRAADELKDIDAINERVNKGKSESPDQDENYREPLSIDTTKTVKIQLSWGGDGDGFKLEYSNDNELISGVYYWEDWGVYQEVSLSDEEADKVAAFYYIEALNY